MRQAPREPVDPDHDEGVAGAEAVEQAREFRSGAAGAGGLLLEDLRAVCGVQLAQLRLKVLGLDQDPGNSRVLPPAYPSVGPLLMQT